MTKAQLATRFEEIINQDIEALKRSRKDNPWMQGHIQGHKEAFQSAKKMLEEIT